MMNVDSRLTTAQDSIQRSVPIADQIKDILEKKILNGDFPVGSQLPSESALCTSLGVSRATIRTALATLEAFGLIVRKHGSGTFVSRNQSYGVMSLEKKGEFFELIQKTGRRAGITVMNVQKRSPTEREASRLEIPSVVEVIALERIFTADSNPVMYSINVLPVHIIRHDYPAEIFERDIAEFLDKYCETIPKNIVMDISATKAKKPVAELLKIPLRTPILNLREIFYNHSDCPVMVTDNLYAGREIRVRFG